jgi:hypothetical protein
LLDHGARILPSGVSRKEPPSASVIDLHQQPPSATSVSNRAFSSREVGNSSEAVASKIGNRPIELEAIVVDRLDEESLCL